MSRDKPILDPVPGPVTALFLAVAEFLCNGCAKAAEVPAAKRFGEAHHFRDSLQSRLSTTIAPMERSARVLELAAEAGFDLAGFAPLGPPRDADRFRD